MNEDFEPLIRFYQSKYDEMRTKVRQLESLMKDMEETTGKNKSELMHEPLYRSTHYSWMSHKRWEIYYKEKLEELMGTIKVSILPSRLTFSIDTNKSHGRHTDFFAEVTAITNVEHESEYEAIERIINACLKLFWVVFDSYKDLKKDYKNIWGTEQYNKLLRMSMAISKKATVIEESNLDYFIKSMILTGSFKCKGDIGCPEYITRSSLDYYVTREKIIKIGSERLVQEKQALNYPEVYIRIEVKGRGIIKECKLIIAETTEIDMRYLLGMDVMI